MKCQVAAATFLTPLGVVGQFGADKCHGRRPGLACRTTELLLQRRVQRIKEPPDAIHRHQHGHEQRHQQPGTRNRGAGVGQLGTREHGARQIFLVQEALDDDTGQMSEHQQQHQVGGEFVQALEDPPLRDAHPASYRALLFLAAQREETGDSHKNCQ